MILAFEAWAAKVWQIGAGLGAEVSLADFRKDMILDFYNEAGQLAISYKIYRAGYRSIRRCPIWTPTPTRWRSSTSSWRTKAGSGTSRSPNRPSRASPRRTPSVSSQDLMRSARSRFGADTRQDEGDPCVLCKEKSC